MRYKHSTAHTFLVTGLIVLLTGIQAGCARLGSFTLESERFNYNMAVQKTNNEQLLLNLVRLKYRDNPFFMEITSVASQYTLTTEASGTASLSSTRPGIFGLGLGTAFEERPTVTYSPMQGDKFVQAVLSPVPIETLALLLTTGWSVSRVSNIILQKLGPIKNALGSGSPTPNRVPEYNNFKETVNLLHQFQIADDLEVSFSKKNGAPRLILDLTQRDSNRSELEQISKALGFDTIKTRFVLTYVYDPEEPDQLVIRTRSLIALMYYLSHSVQVPEQHKDEGKVTMVKGPDGKTFDWSNITGDLLRIQSADSKPSNASVAIYYRNTWFYIDDSDLNSKSTFLLLAQIFSLQAGKIQDVAPLLTLPIGG